MGKNYSLKQYQLKETYIVKKRNNTILSHDIAQLRTLYLIKQVLINLQVVK